MATIVSHCKIAIPLSSGWDMANAIMNTVTMTVCRRPVHENDMNIGEELVRKKKGRGWRGRHEGKEGGYLHNAFLT